MPQNIPLFQTSRSPEELRAQLKAWQPWSIRIDFNNGVSTMEFERRKPFAEYPLNKFRAVETAIPFADLSGGSLLDIGCNSGYNSIHAATAYRMRPVGIDLTPRHIEVSRFLASLVGVKADFLIASAEEFSRPGEFDAVLHFGTLYHLPNPFLALQLAFKNLRPGGYLALETQVYDHPEDSNICYFMHMQNNDPTNFWALSTAVIDRCLALLGFVQVQHLKKIIPALGLAQYMSRVILVAQKPA